ncbi:MAG: hypothetical protein AABW86_04370 [Candidatus Micrarchaeota archaeon]
MCARFVQKMSYKYEFSEGELKPLVDIQTMLEDDDPLQQFSKFMEKVEPPAKEAKKDISVAIAEVQDDVASHSDSSLTSMQGATEREDVQSSHYVITFFNPETGKAEVLGVSSEIRVKDYAKKVIEESLGQQSTLPLYTFIATPIIRKEVNPYLLEDLINNMEYGTPPPFGGSVKISTEKSAAILREKAASVKQSEIVAVSRLEQRQKNKRADEIQEPVIVATSEVKKEKPSNLSAEHYNKALRADQHDKALRAKHNEPEQFGTKQLIEPVPIDIEHVPINAGRSIKSSAHSSEIVSATQNTKLVKASEQLPHSVSVSQKKEKTYVPAIKSEVVLEPSVKHAIEESIVRKERAETDIGQEIVSIERVVVSIRDRHIPLEKAILALPPITRARFSAVVKKKHLPASMILSLLEKDISFLKSVKKKLATLSFDDLLSVVRAVKSLSAK